MSKISTEYWQILNDFQDLMSGSYRVPHGDPPEPQRQPAEDSAAASEGSSDTPSAESSLNALAERIRTCRACGLGSLRTHAVPGEGSSHPRVMVIGEGPGAQEDQSGRPFVGRAGQYLDKWLSAIGLSREKEAFITNVIKCRPPENRDPEENEMQACMPHLLAQIEILKPEAILCVGRFAGRRLTGEETTLNKLRGRLHRFHDLPVVVTYHPSAVLRNAELRRPVWDDLQRLKDLLEQ